MFSQTPFFLKKKKKKNLGVLYILYWIYFTPYIYSLSLKNVNFISNPSENAPVL